MLLIFVPEITERVKFTFDVCFNAVSFVPYKLTTDLEFFYAEDCPKFWYNFEKIDNYFGFIAHNLLFEDKISASMLKSYFNGDMFAQIFFLASNYTSYFPEAQPRFPKRPLINMLVYDKILTKLKKNFHNFSFQLPMLQHIPTIDVDLAFKYKYKSFLKTCAWFCRDLLRADKKALIDRYKVLTKKISDPWDCFDKIIEFHNKHNVKPIFFFLVGKQGKFDRNIPLDNPEMQAIIKNLDEQRFEIGLHTSVGGLSDFENWKTEKESLENLIGKKITKSRQHFIKLNFPESFKNFEKIGIKSDFSIIDKQNLCFRLGTTVPIKFFDLQSNTISDLTIVPSAIMDVSLRDYKKLSVEDAKEACKRILSYYKQYGGTFVTIWHNESFSEDGKWANWNEVYEYIID